MGEQGNGRGGQRAKRALADWEEVEISGSGGRILTRRSEIQEVRNSRVQAEK